MQTNENVESQTTQKKQNWIVRLWKYFSVYEKIWLFSIVTLGIVLHFIFPEEQGWLRIFEIIVIIGGCTCELLLAKQTKWAFIVSIFFYDLASTVIYVCDGLYISAVFELIYWIPILVASFFVWEKRKDKENQEKTKVRKINWKKDIMIFGIALVASFGLGAIFTWVGGIFEGMTKYWYFDALKNTFAVCNGIFILLCFREQWLAWYLYLITEAVVWILAGEYVMLALTLGYLTNSTYGLIKWSKYAKAHPETNTEPLILDKKKEPTKTTE